MTSRLFVVACLLAFAGIPSAQNVRGSLTGTVSGPDGTPVAGAPIQVRNTETDAVARTLSSAAGRFTFPGLPAGTYELSIAMPCCALESFGKSDITLQTGQTVQLDVRLKEGDPLNTLSDDPATLAAVIRKRSAVPSQPAPRTPDGKPDLSGVWLVNQDLYPERPAALPWAAALAKERIENNSKDNPHTRCLPGPPPVPGATLPFMAKFVHTPSLLVILFEDAPGFRQVFLDARGHPADPNPTWLGHAVGKWEGETLVVDTVGFNDKSWLGTYPHTEKLHITERYRRPDFGHLEIRVRIEDPETFTKPWNQNMNWELAPLEDLLEYVCTENNKTEHLIGK
jgi:hypothetical protein